MLHWYGLDLKFVNLFFSLDTVTDKLFKVMLHHMRSRIQSQHQKLPMSRRMPTRLSMPRIWMQCSVWHCLVFSRRWCSAVKCRRRIYVIRMEQRWRDISWGILLSYLQWRVLYLWAGIWNISWAFQLVWHDIKSINRGKYDEHRYG